MQTHPCLIIPACIFECSKNSGGGLERRKVNLSQKYQMMPLRFPFCSLWHHFPIPTAFSLPIANVPASPSVPGRTWSAILCCHPRRGGWSSVDRPGESGQGRPRDVGSAAEGEGQAVSRTGAHCLWGEVYFTQHERFIPTLPYRSKTYEERTHHPASFHPRSPVITDKLQVFLLNHHIWIIFDTLFVLLRWCKDIFDIFSPHFVLFHWHQNQGLTVNSSGMLKMAAVLH